MFVTVYFEYIYYIYQQLELPQKLAVEQPLRDQAVQTFLFLISFISTFFDDKIFRRISYVRT
jgi:hypothetical protein